MAEVPEHLLKRSAERRKQLGLPGGEGDDDAPAAECPAPDAPARHPPRYRRRPPHRTRVRSPKTRVAFRPTCSSARASARLRCPAVEAAARWRRHAATATATAPIATPTGTGPGGHTQRLLTVVKSGSIQQTRAEAQDKVHTWPHLLVIEFAAALALTAMLLVFSAIVRAPLLGLADVNQTPNPSKAPWYFLGLQELLTMFHPMVAGVTIPGMGLFLLIIAPYVDSNPSNKPNDRKFAISLFTIFLMFWAVLVIIGSFFRGAGFNFVFPWHDGIFFEL